MEIMARKAEAGMPDEALQVIYRNVDLVQENKKLKAEIASQRKQLDNVRLLLRHEKYLADKYREIRREQNAPAIKTWIRDVIDGMDEAWAMRVVIGTAIMCSISLAIAWLAV